jgi:signal transduction histidine kinase
VCGVRRLQAVIEWFRRRPVWVGDGILGVLVAVADIATTAELAPREVVGPMQVSPAVALVLLLAGTLPIAARRLAPIPIAAVTGVTGLCTAYLLVPTTGIGAAVALYTVAAHRPRNQAFLTAGVTLTCILTMLTATTGLSFTMGNIVMVVSVTALGDRARVARERAVALEERARELEGEREARLRLAVTAERTRIARELHDITAHGIAVIAVQAAGARRVLHADPDRAAEALREIEETARDGLTRMRQAVALVREGAPDAAPQPGLAELDTLITRFRDAGLLVEADLPDPQRHPDPAVGLTVYRIVQEGLTNTLRHAGRTTAWVRVSAGPDEVRVVVHDDGPADATVPPQRTGPPGYGLLGLRERVRSHGGELSVLHADGHRLEARIPLDDRDRHPVPAGQS